MRKKRFKVLFILFFPSVLFAEKLIITQTYSYFDMNVEWTPEKVLNYEARNLFGILLPQTWKIADENDFTITFYGKEPVCGKFAWCQFYSDSLNMQHKAPDGYYWWGGRSYDKTQYDRATKFSFKVRIYTGKQTGNFNLKYSLGDDPSNTINNHFISLPVPVTVTFGNEFPAKKDYDWELIGRNRNPSCYQDHDFDRLFLRYYGWNGGDIGITTLLPDGRNVWTWGDYHTGTVNSRRSRLTELSQFPRNALMLQEGTDFSAFKLLTKEKLGTIKPILTCKDDNGNEINGSDEWYWPMGGNICYRNGIPELQLVLEHVVNAGGGAWGMKAVSCDVAVFSLPDLNLKTIIKNRYTGDIAFANIVFKDDDGIVYLYGEKNHGTCESATFAARNIEGDLAGDWEFYDAKNKKWDKNHSWENTPGWLDYKIINNPVFVFKDGGKYYAFEQEACFGRKTYIYDAASPTGPFTNKRQAGELPADISTGPFFCYIPVLHQQFSKDGELLYSVSKNNRDISWYEYPGSGDIYLPHFFRIKQWRNKLNLTPNDITANGGTLWAAQTETLANLTDKNENTAYAVTANNRETRIQYKSDKPLYLRRYTLTSAQNDRTKDPLHWQISGSADGENWILLDERFHAEFEERGQTNGYTVPIDGIFTYFRLNILATNGSADMQIAEWQLFGQYADTNPGNHGNQHPPTK
ncbi:MAG: DUF5005 domain-containing protein [Tannerella sp.]|jgi:hypothetical protein|nr:DUF5005 domain-containing protein [Tannerella sp.]